ncbi:MAG: hypothetical protein IJ017_06505 [Oscillospiraceae bacterium]|nr:hypothetical protein [Oscillospiraceae bacterium]
MPDYQKLYTMLFNSITDALKMLDRLDILTAKEVLIEAQQKAEEEYIDGE